MSRSLAVLLLACPSLLLAASAAGAQQADDPLVLLALADVQLREARRSGEHEELEVAESSYLRVLERAPESKAAWLGVAYARLGAHRFEEALDAARSAARLAPDDVAARALLCDVHFALGNYAEADALSRTLAQQELTLGSLARRGLLAEARGEREQALSYFEDALQAGKLLHASRADLAWCHSMIGEQHLQANRLDEAEHHFERALRLDANSHFSAHALAEVHQARGDWQVAEHLLRELIARAPQPGFWVQLGEVLEAQGKTAEARAWYDKSEQDMLGDYEAGDFGHLRELAELWLAHGGDPERAWEVAALDLEEVRHDSGAYETAAWAAYRLGELPKAAALMREAVRMGGGEPRRFERAAEIFEAAGKELLAAHYRRTAAELGS